MAKCLDDARQALRIHSEIGGPWMPEDVVMGMVECVKIGWLAKWSMPAEKRWINLRLEKISVWRKPGLRCIFASGSA